MTENDYVATATAEKRLREVLEERFTDREFAGRLTTTLLSDAEITYLPRKKSVSIVLRVPATAGSKPIGDTVHRLGEELPTEPEYNPTAGSDIPDPVAGRDYMSDSIPVPHQQARFGLFTPTSTDESDYFTE